MLSLQTITSLALLTVTSPRSANRHISPFEGGWGDVNCQIVTSPPLKEVRELAQQSICKEGMLQIVKSPNRQIC